jgi:hypothetical protein
LGALIVLILETYKRYNAPFILKRRQGIAKIMDRKKLAFLIILVVAVGVIVLPTIVWYIEEEWVEEKFPAESMVSEGVDPTYLAVMAEIWVGGAHLNFTCATCHHSPIADFDFHVECMDCHGATGNISGHWETLECRDCAICHWSGGSDIASYFDFVSAGGFGMNATPFDVGSMAGHEGLILVAMENTTMAGANEACVACHTEISVSNASIDMSDFLENKTYMGFDAGMGNVSNFVIED